MNEFSYGYGAEEHIVAGQQLCSKSVAIQHESSYKYSRSSVRCCTKAPTFASRPTTNRQMALSVHWNLPIQL